MVTKASQCTELLLGPSKNRITSWGCRGTELLARHPHKQNCKLEVLGVCVLDVFNEAYKAMFEAFEVVKVWVKAIR